MVAPALPDARPPSQWPFPAGHLLPFKVELSSLQKVGSPGPRLGWASQDAAHLRVRLRSDSPHSQSVLAPEPWACSWGQGMSGAMWG